METVPQLFSNIYQHMARFESCNGAEKMEGAFNIVGDLFNLTKKLTKVTNGEVGKNLREIQKDLDVMLNEERIARKKVKECEERTTVAKHKGAVFTDMVKDFLKFADLDKVERENIDRATKSGDLVPIEQFITRIKRMLIKCEQCYNDFKREYDVTRELCRRIKEESEDKVATSKTKENKVRNLSLASLLIWASSGLSAVVAVYYENKDHIIIAGTFFFAAIIILLCIRSYGKNIRKMHDVHKKFHDDVAKLENDIESVGLTAQEIQEKKLAIMKNRAEAVLEEYQQVDQRVGSQYVCKSFHILLDGVRECRQQMLVEDTKHGQFYPSINAMRDSKNGQCYPNINGTSY